MDDQWTACDVLCRGILFPILLTLFTATGESGWITACYFMLAMGILSWILYAMIPMENDRVEKEKKGGSFWILLRTAVLSVRCNIIFLSLRGAGCHRMDDHIF